jgi:hypothetical protein
MLLSYFRYLFLPLAPLLFLYVVFMWRSPFEYLSCHKCKPISAKAELNEAKMERQIKKDLPPL